MMTAHFVVKGMSCSGCAQSIVRRLSGTTGVTAVNADNIVGTADVSFDETLVSPHSLAEMIDALGFEAELVESPNEV